MHQVSPIRQTVLENGLTIISEQMNHVRSAAVGIWVRSGSRHEQASQNGISHFIEHTLFKGTRNRSSREIAVESDAIGGHVDAFTSREIAAYYVRVLDEHLARSFDLISDLVTNPLFAEEELDRERNVVTEEIKMVEDTPDDLVQEVFVANFWPDHPLGRSILGTVETLGTFDHQRVAEYFANVYTPRNLVVSGAGHLEHERFVDMVGHHLGDLKDKPTGLSVSPPSPATRRVVLDKDLEQAHLVLGTRCPPMTSPDRYAVHLLNVILGGGMSSRLFQTIREEHGLAYAVFSGVNSYTDAGFMSVYAATSPDQINDVVRLSVEEFGKLKKEAVTDAELQRAKDQFKVSIMLSLESTSARMSNLARQEIFFGRQFTLDEMLERINRVTAEDVQRMACEIFGSDDLAITAVGQLGSLSLDLEQQQRIAV
ncbi:MAG TPA: pitrilysin family protein [Blastocatellia bacterium]|jgi:predicted Zn-dependent peptidase|nr:pitrilysin family protein [Blastocatellia bacterium]